MADELSLVKSLFSSIETNLFYGDQLGTGEFATLMHPGQFISTKLDPDRDPNDGYTLFENLNDVLDSLFVHSSLDRTVSNVYKEILTFAALPKKALSQQDMADKVAAEAYISAHFDTYQAWKDIFQQADLAYQQALLVEHPDFGEIQRLSNVRATAADFWEQKGNKIEFESRWSDVQYLESGDPRTWFTELKKRFDQYARNAPKGPYYTTLLDPAPKTWDTAGWGEITLSASDTVSSSYSRSTEWSGGGGLNFGFWSVGGSGGGASTYTHDHSKATTMTATFKFLRARILRPWLVPDLFTYAFWTWRKVHGWTDISTGGNVLATPPQRPMGPRGMPYLQKSVVVVKDLVLKANFTETDNTTITSRINGSIGFGWGPFSISGSYSEGSTQKDATATVRDGALMIPQPQIIAFLGTLTPKCPNPDLSLPFDLNDIATPSQPQPGYFEELRSIAAIDWETRITMREYHAAVAKAKKELATRMEETRTHLVARLAQTTAKMSFTKPDAPKTSTENPEDV